MAKRVRDEPAKVSREAGEQQGDIIYALGHNDGLYCLEEGGRRAERRCDLGRVEEDGRQHVRAAGMTDEVQPTGAPSDPSDPIRPRPLDEKLKKMQEILCMAWMPEDIVSGLGIAWSEPVIWHSYGELRMLAQALCQGCMIGLVFTVGVVRVAVSTRASG